VRYDLTTPIKDLAGVQLTDAQDGIGYTLGSVLVRTALFLDKAKLPTPPEKQAAYTLAKRLATAGSSVDLSIDDVAFLKTQAGAMWSTLVMGQVWELLEQPLLSTKQAKVAEAVRHHHEVAAAQGKPAAGIPEEA
jgi:hypothetical protein